MVSQGRYEPNSQDWEGYTLREFEMEYVVPIIDQIPLGDSIEVVIPDSILSTEGLLQNGDKGSPNQLSTGSIAGGVGSVGLLSAFKASANSSRRSFLRNSMAAVAGAGLFLATGKRSRAASCDGRCTTPGRCNIYAPGRGYASCTFLTAGCMSHCANVYYAVSSCPADHWAYCFSKNCPTAC